MINYIFFLMMAQYKHEIDVLFQLVVICWRRGLSRGNSWVVIQGEL